jgi:hypothetical protein
VLFPVVSAEHIPALTVPVYEERVICMLVLEPSCGMK